MRSTEKHGLICAGSAVRSSLQRLPSLHARIGPIKGVSFPATRRVVLKLRTGFAVPNYGALEFCPVIWVIVPEPKLEAALRDLAAQTPLSKTMIVVFDSPRESSSFDFLKGTRIATLNAVDDSRQTAFVAEGHRDALRMLRQLTDQDKRKLVELRAGGKAGYLAGVHLMAHLMRALVTSAINCLQAAGIARPEALDMVTALATRSVKAHGRAGAKPWTKPELLALRNALEQHSGDLQQICPLEATVYAQAVKLALEYFESLGTSRKKVRSHHA